LVAEDVTTIRRVLTTVTERSTLNSPDLGIPDSQIGQTSRLLD